MFVVQIFRMKAWNICGCNFVHVSLATWYKATLRNTVSRPCVLYHKFVMKSNGVRCYCSVALSLRTVQWPTLTHSTLSPAYSLVQICGHLVAGIPLNTQCSKHYATQLTSSTLQDGVYTLNIQGFYLISC